MTALNQTENGEKTMETMDVITIEDPQQVVGGDYFEASLGIIAGLSLTAGIIASGGLLLAAAAAGAVLAYEP